MPKWVYEPSTNRYRDTATGRFIGQEKRVELRDEWTQSQKLVTDKLAEDYDSGKLSLSDFVKGMREEIKINNIEQYLLGAGGRNNMTPADWGRLGNRIKGQYEFMQEFGQDILDADPPLTLAQIQARARMYVDSSTAMYERANALAAGMPDLPEYPADGKQDCKSNCKCHWQIEDKGKAWEATWVLEETAEHCESCIDNANKWSPLVIEKA